MRIQVRHDGGGVQQLIFIESPTAYLKNPQMEGYSVEINEKTDMKQMAYILRDSIYIVGYDRPTKGRRTKIIVPTPHIVSIEYPEASE